MPGKHHLRGFKIAKKIGSPLRGSWTMVSIALVDARKTSLMGVQNSKKNRLAATRLVDDAPHRRWVKPPPLGKKLDPPLGVLAFRRAYAPGREFLYRRMVSEARGDLFVKATCLENSDQSLTLFLTE